MYEIERKDGRVIVRKGDNPRLNAPDSSSIVYKDANGATVVNRLKDLKDDQLLIALASAIELPIF